MEIWIDIFKGEVIKIYPTPNVPFYSNRQVLFFKSVNTKCLNNFRDIYVHTLAFPNQGCHCTPLARSAIYHHF